MSYYSINYLNTARATTVTLLDKFNKEVNTPTKKHTIDTGSNATVILAYYGIEKGAELLEQNKDLIALNKLIFNSGVNSDYDDNVPALFVISRT